MNIYIQLLNGRTSGELTVEDWVCVGDPSETYGTPTQARELLESLQGHFTTNSMFPFSYNSRIIVTSEGEQEINTTELLLKFNEQFDNPSFMDRDTISFDNFNFYLKRHGWLSKGVLKITEKDNQVFADLNLGFHTTPVILALLSIGLVVMNMDNLWFALFGIAAFWTFYALLYLWTITMFEMTIKRTIGHELFLKHSGLDDDQTIVLVKDTCPGCGAKVKSTDAECTECGLYFGGD